MLLKGDVKKDEECFVMFNSAGCGLIEKRTETGLSCSDKGREQGFVERDADRRRRIIC